jgi:pyridoxal phosphate enzyme (YggS family)
MIENNLKSIKDRIIAAATRVNRAPDEIKIVAVSKLIPEEKILEAVKCGHFTFGENYIQEALEKIPAIRTSKIADEISFHFIGKLQSNKAKKAAELFDVIETVDSVKLANTLENHLSIQNKTVSAYVQVNVGREKQKSGILPEDCQRLLQEISHLQHLKIVGLMTMPPYFDNPEKTRPYFIKLRKLSEELTGLGLLGKDSPTELSMGMSGDFEAAIEEGATVIRIGTAIFGQRSS